MKFLKSTLIATVLGACSVQSSFAIGAYPRPIVMKQPDGTTLLVRIQGDENFHFVTTSDGFLVKKDKNGFFCYVDYDMKTGKKSITSQRAHNINERDANEKALLKELKAAQTVNADILSKNNIVRKGHLKTLDKDIIAPKRIHKANATVKESQYLVILVNFADSTFRYNNVDFDRWLNEKGYSVNGGTGSVKDYYRDNSMEQFVPNFKVVGPYTLSHPTKYYGENTSDASASDARPREMVKEACLLAKADHPELDFSQFDNSGNGTMDNCYVIYAGYSEASTANDDDIWPHSWNMGDEKFQIDGITINEYSCSAELVGMPGSPAQPSMDGIGTFTHEFGHVLGLKDQYDTDSYTNGKGLDPGDYSLYASGSYNNDSHTPPCLMAFERMQMGWMTEGADITEIKNPEDVELEGISENKARFINAQPERAAGTGMEWFIIENRQQTGWDRYIPAHGMLITHYDYTKEMQDEYWSINGPNNNAKHRCMYIVPADGVDDANSREGDTFPGTTANTSFTDDTTPNSLNWNGERLSVPVTNITEDNGMIKFQVSGGVKTWNVIKTDVPTDIRDVSAVFSATVGNTNVDIDEVGFCWSAGNNEPTLDDSHAAATDTKTPKYTATDLLPGSNYSVRSYMKMSDGTTVYGSAVPFSTECATVTAPFQSDFTSWTNGQPDCWKIIDNNGDGTTWVADESSNSIVYSFDYWNDADDYLICKRRIHVPNNGALFFTRGVTEETSIESLEVLVSTKTSNLNDFHVIDRLSFADYFSQQHIEEVDISKYAGQDIYVAFHCNSEKLQGDLWLWNIMVAEKLATPVITDFSRKDAQNLHVAWTQVNEATGYYLYLGKETDKANQEALFTPMSYYKEVEGDVTLGTGSIFFKSSGCVTLKEITEGIDDCKFIVTTSGPLGSSEMFVEGTKDGGQTWQSIGAKISLTEYDSEGQECDLSSYVAGKKYKQLRFRFNHGGRNGRVKYLTLVFNDGMQYQTLAAGGVYDTKIDIKNQTPGEFDSGKYKVWVASGYGNLFFDESLPAYYSAEGTSVTEIIDGTDMSVKVSKGMITLNGIKSGYTVRCTSITGTLLYSGTATGNSISFPTSGTESVAIISVNGNGKNYRTKAIIK